MIEKLIDSDFYIHYPMIKLKPSTISACIPLITHLYDKLNIEYFDHYSNDTFELHPYLDLVDCDCGWEDLPEWEELYRLEHRSECFQSRFSEFKRIYGLMSDEVIYMEALERWFRDLFRERGWDKQDPWWSGIASRCDCDYRDREKALYLKMVERFGPGHRVDCILFRPQFLYKPTDLRIWWHKTPMRCAAISQHIDDKTLIDILQSCIDSVGVQR